MTIKELRDILEPNKLYEDRIIVFKDNNTGLSLDINHIYIDRVSGTVVLTNKLPFSEDN